MVVYSYDGNTGRFIAGEMADPDPLEPGCWLIPANATTEMPPESKLPNLWPYWNGLGWELKGEGIENKAREMRTIRNSALACSDWTQLPDAPLDGRQLDAWRRYRQALRDITNSPAWPFVDLPVKP